MKNIKLENGPKPNYISQEFLTMNSASFRKLLRSKKNEPYLKIEIDWIDVPTARKLKAFLEDSKTVVLNQKRSATVRATEGQYNQEINAFESGVTWKKI